MITVIDADEHVAIMKSPTITVTSKHPVTIAVATMEVSNGQTIEATGIAVCAPCDSWSPNVGKTLASARAIRKIAEAMEHYGNKSAARRHRG